MTTDPITLRYIQQHKKDDIRTLALHPVKGVDMPFALDQIAGWQTARKKLPTWAATEGLIYPPHINMEQCSSEVTARYKSDLSHLSDPSSLSPDPSPSGRGESIPSERSGGEVPHSLEENGDGDCFIDLTGGFGVDFSFMSRGFGHAVYVERNERLCEIARHNFKTLGLKNAEVVCGDGVEYLHALPEVDSSKLIAESSKLRVENSRPQKIIYLDPSRRDVHGRKVYGIEDCTPDVLALKDELLAKADKVIIKLSPMLDWHDTVAKMGSGVTEVHIVSVENECKEMIINLSPSPKREGECNTIKLVCVNFDKGEKQITTIGIASPSPIGEGRGGAGGLGGACVLGGALFIPNASIMKAGCFAELAQAYSLQMLDNNSHLFVGDKDINDFPGRKFVIDATTTMNKHELKEKLKDVDKANIAVRNFPLSADALRKRLKLKDGGNVYLFATTVRGKHIIYITHKAQGRVRPTHLT